MNNENNFNLDLQDDLKSDDNMALKPTMRGIVTAVDDTGRVVFSKRANLIVLRGRTAALEMLFQDTIGSAGITGSVANPYISNLSRSICGFAVGNGGAVSAATPFEPVAVNPLDRWLASAVPFRIHDSTATASEPSIFIPTAERANYAHGVAVTNQPNQRAYYVKCFDSLTPSWGFNAATNEVYKEITMSVTAADCRSLASPMINELMLVFAQKLAAKDSNGCTQMKDVEIFSRITFPTEYLATDKSLAITYRIYA